MVVGMLTIILSHKALEDLKMDKVESGQKYKHKTLGDFCIINNMRPKGRGYSVCYLIDGFKFGLITSRGNFLSCWELVDGT